MASRIVTNTTNATVTFVGQEIAASASFTIPSNQYYLWSGDNATIAALTSGALSIGDGTNTMSAGAQAVQYMLNGTITQKDSDGADLARVKQAPTGYTYIMKGFDFTTSTLNSLNNNTVAGADMGDVTMLFYDASGNQLTDQGSITSSCVKTVLNFEPTHDYYILGGEVRTTSQPTQDLRLYAIVAPGIPASVGGSVALLSNLNLKYLQPGDSVQADGRAAKQLTYSSTLHTSLLQYVFIHEAGFAQPLAITMEYFRDTTQGANN